MLYVITEKENMNKNYIVIIYLILKDVFFRGRAGSDGYVTHITHITHSFFLKWLKLLNIILK